MEKLTLQSRIQSFLSLDVGYGDGYGYGYGDGYGYGYVRGYGGGIGSSSGYVRGYGDDIGSGYGRGSSSGYGDGRGYGDGSGDGSGIAAINGETVYAVDYIQTIIKAVHGNIAKVFILNADLTLAPCYVVKGNGYFAHGDTLREAMEALTNKIMKDMPEEKRIAAFINAHPDKDKPYPNRDLFDWHHRLTGSCEAGRNAFIRNRGLTLDGETTVTAFIEMTQNAYNGSVIRNLGRAYKETGKVVGIKNNGRK